MRVGKGVDKMSAADIESASEALCDQKTPAKLV